MVFSQHNSKLSAYKDPVENHRVRKISDKIITGFFVFTFGILWYFSTKYHFRPNDYSIVIHDVFGKEITMNDLRTEFKTKEVTSSYISEYQNRFPQYNFSIKLEFPEIKRKSMFRILKTHK